MSSPHGKGDLVHAIQIPPPPSDTNYLEDPERWDLVIIGGGISGCALAHSQGTGNRRILLLERDLTQPDRFVGEFLQPGGILKLRQLGLGHCVEDIDAQQINGLCMTKGGKEALLEYPIPGLCFNHGLFIQKLRHAAASNPAVTLRQAVATALLNEEGGLVMKDEDVVGGVLYRTPDGVERRAVAALTVVCDGMHSNLRPKVGVPAITRTAYQAAVTLTGCDLARRNFVQLLAEEPIVSLYPISTTEIRCMMIIPGTSLPSVASGALRDYLTATVAPRLPKDVREAFLRAVQEGPIRNVQTKCMPAMQRQRPGAVLLGDALNMRHPATGAGMTVALNDVKLLADMSKERDGFISSGGSGARTAAFLSRRRPLSASMNMLSYLVYNVFAVQGGEDREVTRAVVHEYMALGGWCGRTLALLLGGVDERPCMVLLHCLGIAAFGVWRLFLSSPSVEGLQAVVKMLCEDISIIWPIMWQEGGPAVFFSSSAPPHKVLTDMGQRFLRSMLCILDDLQSYVMMPCSTCHLG
eukprot:jgi/Botrbrau1/10444/Bobra.0133s0051.1